MHQSDLDAISTARNLPNARAQNEHGYTLLHEAALSCNSSSIWRISSLIDINADVHAVAKNGWSPLHIALFRKDADKQSVIKVLTEANANVNAVDKEGWTLLHKAAANGDSNKKEFIVSLIKTKADVNAVDSEGKPPLFIASSSRGFDVEKTLIDYNADINHRDLKGNTVLHNLFLSTNTNDIPLKLIFLAGEVIKHDPSWLTLPNKAGKTPLYCAAFRNSEQQEGEFIHALGLRHAASFIKLAQEHGAPISLSPDELNRFVSALQESTKINSTPPESGPSQDITTISVFLSQQPQELFDALPASLELTGHDDDYYLGVD
jgi:hypothetical protein